MKTKVTVVKEGRHPGDVRTLAVLELPRVPMKGEYIVIKNQRYEVVRVEYLDSGGVVVEVD